MMESFAMAHNAENFAPIVKTMQIWANETYNVDLLAVQAEDAGKIAKSFGSL